MGEAMTTSLPILRASSMKMAVECPASVAAKRPVLVDAFDETSIDGSDVHRAIALQLRSKPCPPFTGDTAAENEAMVELAIDWYHAHIQPFYPVVTFEERLTHAPIAGTIDVLAISADGRKAVVADWKTTYREDDHTAQLAAYAYLVFMECPLVEEVVIYTAYLRGEGIHDKVLYRNWVIQWMEEFQQNTLSHPEIHRVGEHCLRCVRRIGCKALVETNRQTAATLMEISQGRELMREVVGTLRPHVKLLEAVIEDFNKFIQRSVIESGPIETSPGKEIRALPIKTDHVQLLPAWEILQQNFTDAEMGEFVEVRKSAMLKLIGDRTPKGKGKAQEAFIERLRSAGAVHTTSSFQIRELNKRDNT
jgi:hypothetical protein